MSLADDMLDHIHNQRVSRNRMKLLIIVVAIVLVSCAWIGLPITVGCGHSFRVVAHPVIGPEYWWCYVQIK